ncbi:hypothetical protein Nepgr_017369 [Nepenthes gracilis]|uniref:Uncharacterized protein n=1 Tax=Nepenthes gracilis TaxID=150966 RepID=A0AAD3SPB0_NEPGR|nr:hypothetical protein Nepgr_017369 [Nepenthes gracilis]
MLTGCNSAAVQLLTTLTLCFCVSLSELVAVLDWHGAGVACKCGLLIPSALLLKLVESLLLVEECRSAFFSFSPPLAWN